MTVSNNLLKAFSPLLAELGHWDKQGKQATLWLRDDDAIDDGPILQRLINTCSGAHLTLAVIPKFASEALFKRVTHSDNVWVLQHGWQHLNHAPPNEKKSEFGEHRSIDTMLVDISLGWNALAPITHRRLPVFVPPWNRIEANLIKVLQLKSPIPYKISVYTPRSKQEKNLYTNTHVDIINWRQDREFIGMKNCIQAITAHLKQRRTSALNLDPEEPTGILLHHKDHDDACWQFLETFMLFCSQHKDIIRWVTPDSEKQQFIRNE